MAAIMSFIFRTYCRNCLGWADCTTLVLRFTKPDLPEQNMQQEPKNTDDLSAVWRRAEHQRTRDLVQWIVEIAARRAVSARPVRFLFARHWRTAGKRLEAAASSPTAGGEMAPS
jgi:hypothetical protein